MGLGGYFLGGVKGTSQQNDERFLVQYGHSTVWPVSVSRPVAPARILLKMTERSEVLFIGGRAGVGKTSVAFELHEHLYAAQIEHCVIEGDNLDLAYPRPWEHNLAERNLADMWRNYRALGYRRLIYTNTVSVLQTEVLTAAMGDNPIVKAVLLRASDDTAATRLGGRETATTLELYLDKSRERAAELEQQTPSWVWRINTDHKDVSAVAGEILGLLDWT